MFAIGELGRDFSCVIESPKEAAVLLVPKDFAQILHAVIDDWQKSILQIGPRDHDARRYPGHSALED